MTVLHRFSASGATSTDVVCFPHAGGHAEFYKPWRDHLPTGMALHAVEYPGRGRRARETPAAALTDLADQAVRVLVTRQQDMPLVLFGHSMGALVAFEVALRLPQPPAALIVSGVAAAHLTHLCPPLPADDDDAVWQHACHLGGTPQQVHRSRLLRRLILPSLRHDYSLINLYRHTSGERLSCPVVACHAVEDPIVEREQQAAWTELTTGDFELKLFNGGHFYLSAAWDALTQTLSAALRSRPSLLSAEN